MECDEVENVKNSTCSQIMEYDEVEEFKFWMPVKQIFWENTYSVCPFSLCIK